MKNRLQAILENTLFGVCAYWAEVFGIATSSVRLFFIYLSFFTFGSPIFLYLAFAFLMNIRTYLRRQKSTIWDF
jgi:phage shock protein PspC (stress-responsive transcriptional regulator)